MPIVDKGLDGDHEASLAVASDRDKGRIRQGMSRGLCRSCPNCGKGRLFSGYTKPAAICSSCGHDLSNYRADDAPAYFTILIVGHIIVPAMLMLELSQHPASWVHFVLWLPLTLVLTLSLLPPIKGALIGLQWALRLKT